MRADAVGPGEFIGAHGGRVQRVSVRRRKRTLHAPWSVLLIVTLSAMAGAYWTLSRAPAEYSVTAALALSPAGDGRDGAGRRVVTLGRGDGLLVSRFAEALSRPDVVESAADGLRMPAAERVDYVVTSARQPASNVVRVTVEGPDPDRVEALATSLLSTAVEANDGLADLFTPVVVQEPVADGNPVDRHAVFVSVGVGVLVMIVGVGVVLGTRPAVRSSRIGAPGDLPQRRVPSPRLPADYRSR